MAAPFPHDELDRMRALREYAILDTEPEAAFDELTELAASVCGTPVSLLTLVDEDRQWFKSRVGFALPETSREVSFCAHALGGTEVMEVEDALADPRFAENPLVTSDPRIRFYAGAPLVTPGGHPLGTICVIDHEPRTLTQAQRSALETLSRAAIAQLELRRRNEELRELDRVKDEFVSLVSHELRTPIAAILGYVEELREESPGPLNDLQRQFLEIVDRNGRRLLSLVNDLLFVAQADAGRTSFSRDPVDLTEVASDAVASARPAAAAKNVELTADLDGVVLVDGESVRLAQAADNLVANAVKFTPESGRVDVRVAAQERDAVLEVRDTGIGIAPDELPSLFGRFYRTVAASVAGVPGTGLGLAITRAIVEGHGGIVEVESDGRTGTLFRVRLPLAKEGG